MNDGSGLSCDRWEEGGYGQLSTQRWKRPSFHREGVGEEGASMALPLSGSQEIKLQPSHALAAFVASRGGSRTGKTRQPGEGHCVPSSLEGPGQVAPPPQASTVKMDQ
jgi:hypothetical protein